MFACRTEVVVSHAFMGENGDECHIIITLIMKNSRAPHLNLWGVETPPLKIHKNKRSRHGRMASLPKRVQSSKHEKRLI